MEKIYWTASNNNTFLSGCMSANGMLAAVRAARHYLRYELYGEGDITYYDSPDCETPIRQDSCNIFTGYKWKVNYKF